MPRPLHDYLRQRDSHGPDRTYFNKPGTSLARARFFQPNRVSPLTRPHLSTGGRMSARTDPVERLRLSLSFLQLRRVSRLTKPRVRLLAPYRRFAFRTTRLDLSACLPEPGIRSLRYPRRLQPIRPMNPYTPGSATTPPNHLRQRHLPRQPSRLARPGQLRSVARRPRLKEPSRSESRWRPGALVLAPSTRSFVKTPFRIPSCAGLLHPSRRLLHIAIFLSTKASFSSLRA